MEAQYLELGCFGKVACWEEHWEENLAAPSAQAVRLWVEAGRKETGTVETARVRFLFGLPDGSDLVAGVLRPSQDKKGRQFPFAVVTRLDRRPYRRSYELLPLALAPVWEALADAWDSLAGVATKSAFREVLEATLVPSPAPVRQVQSEYEGMQADPLGRIFQRRDGASPQELERNLPALVSRMKSNEAERLIAEIPVSRDLRMACFEAAFWMDLINHQFRFRRLEPAVFLEETAPNTNRTALLAYGPLRPSDYPVVMSGARTGDHIVRPAHGTGGQSLSGDPWKGAVFAEVLKRRF